MADSYLCDELLVETNHAVNSHLEHCSECRREFAARRELRSTLRDAFVSRPENQIRTEFAAHLRADLKESLSLSKRTVGSRRSWLTYVKHGRGRWLALAACLLLAVGLGLVALLHQMSLRRIRAVASNSPPANYSPEVNAGTPLNVLKGELTRNAVGDHRDCAIQFRLAERPIDLETAGKKYDPVYVNLTKALFAEDGGAPPDAEFVEAHSCVFAGRRFAHIVLKYHGRKVSFLVTSIPRDGETIGATAPPVGQQLAIACSQSDGYQVSCFQVAHHAVFVVSDLSEVENLSLARALAPSVTAHITRTESAS
jgi:hypothetical protein